MSKNVPYGYGPYWKKKFQNRIQFWNHYEVQIALVLTMR